MTSVSTLMPFNEYSTLADDAAVDCDDNCDKYKLFSKAEISKSTTRASIKERMILKCD